MNPTEIINCADGVEEAVPRLTHLTLTAHRDLRDSDPIRDELVSHANIDVLLSHLAEAVAGLPQVATQIAGLLENARIYHHLEMDGVTDTTDPDLALDAARLHLDAIRHPAELMYRRLNAARQGTAHIRANPICTSPSDVALSVAPRHPDALVPRKTDLNRDG